MANPTTAFLNALRQVRDSGVAADELLVAYSGGLDSTCLLACAAETRPIHGLPLRALHVDHGWSPESQRWARHCEDTALALGINCSVHRLTMQPAPGESPEAWAREQRYGVLLASTGPGTLVLTAHHQEDQAETFLLMALRGSGAHGLAGIAPQRPFGPGLLLRPFLSLSRQALEAFANQRALRWIEDPSNDDAGFDRNFLRHNVLPLLRQRWPSASATLARSARWQTELAALEDADGSALLQTAGAVGPLLPLAALAGLPGPSALRLLRAWLGTLHVPVPDAGRLERVLTQVVAAAADGQPMIRWGEWALRRYGDSLHLTTANVPALSEDTIWRWEAALHLPTGTLRAVQATGEGIAARWLHGRALEVRARRGGERYRRVGDPHHRSLKHLWQVARVPPWLRSTFPLIHLGDQLLAVPGLGYAADTAPAAGEPSIRFEWLPASQPPGPCNAG